MYSGEKRDSWCYSDSTFSLTQDMICFFSKILNTLWLGAFSPFSDGPSGPSLVWVTTSCRCALFQTDSLGAEHSAMTIKFHASPSLHRCICYWQEDSNDGTYIVKSNTHTSHQEISCARFLPTMPYVVSNYDFCSFTQPWPELIFTVMHDRMTELSNIDTESQK